MFIILLKNGLAFLIPDGIAMNFIFTIVGSANLSYMEFISTNSQINVPWSQ